MSTKWMSTKWMSNKWYIDQMDVDQMVVDQMSGHRIVNSDDSTFINVLFTGAHSG